jgi:hypothetical protein
LNGSGIVYYEFSDSLQIPAVSPGETAAVRLRASRPPLSTTPEFENLYRYRVQLNSGHSYFQYLPVRARVDVDLAPTSGDGLLPGLWVGEARISQTTSVVRGQSDGVTLGGPRLEPVSRPLSYRIILHVNEEGGVSLLGHATLMKEARVAEEIEPEVVVVVDDNRLGDFVGLEQRDGKPVGRRYDTAAYDLPRDPIAPEGSNPVNLTENYLRSLPLEGTLAPGGVVSTTPGTFIIDEWHRSNPFKHVFHPSHRQGFRIEREMTFQVDAADSPSAQGGADFGVNTLSGVFEETVVGLLKTGEEIESRGRFLLNRITPQARFY